ncbi:MAG: prepilin-type N-terminal cleavage/methylation domain-containing protein [Planctomycetota bacterium]
MNTNKGFTLVELVVVILILGILAGVAAPKFFDTSAKANDNSARTTLAIIRDAIEIYTAENGGTPPRNSNEANFLTDIMPYIRGSVFPTCPAGENAGSNNILMGAATTPAGGEGWRYNVASNVGEFFINSDDLTANQDDDPTLNYDEL